MGNKKQFGNVIDDILGNEEPESSTVQSEERRTVGRPKADGYERRTFQVRKDLFIKLKIIAAREGVLQKDILEYVLTEIVEKYEAKHGQIETKVAQAPKTNIKDIF